MLITVVGDAELGAAKLQGVTAGHRPHGLPVKALFQAFGIMWRSGGRLRGGSAVHHSWLVNNTWVDVLVEKVNLFKHC